LVLILVLLGYGLVEFPELIESEDES